MNISENEERLKSEDVLARIHTALDKIGVPKRGRVALVSKKTGYSSGSCSEFLSGKKRLSNRFLSSFFNGFNIHNEWLFYGEGEMLLKDHFAKMSRESQKRRATPEIEQSVVSVGNEGEDADRLEELNVPTERHEEERLKVIDLEIERLKSQMNAVWEYTRSKYPDLVVAFQHVSPQERRFVLAALEYGFDLLPE